MRSSDGGHGDSEASRAPAAAASTASLMLAPLSGWCSITTAADARPAAAASSSDADAAFTGRASKCLSSTDLVNTSQRSLQLALDIFSLYLDLELDIDLGLYFQIELDIELEIELNILVRSLVTGLVTRLPALLSI